MDNLVSGLMQEVGGFITLLALAMIIIMGGLFRDIFVEIVKKRIGHGLKNSSFISGVGKINDELVYLRAKSDAHRALFCQFHNGEKFEADLSRWKVTQTYVSNAFGFDENSLLFENTDVTVIWNLIGTSLGAFKGKLPDGFRSLKSSESWCTDDCVANKGVYLCVVDEISSEMGRLKAMLISRGVQALVFSTVQDKNHKPFGILLLAYCADNWQQTALSSKFEWCQLCNSADLISSFVDGAKKSKYKQFFKSFFKGGNNE